MTTRIHQTALCAAVLLASSLSSLCFAHEDRAPIPDDVAAQLRDRTAPRSRASPSRVLRLQLERAVELLRKVDADSDVRPPQATERVQREDEKSSLISSKRYELKALKKNLQAWIEDAGVRSILGDHPTRSQRGKEAWGKIEKKFDNLDQLLDGLKDTDRRAKNRKGLSRAIDELENQIAKMREDDGALPDSARPSFEDARPVTPIPQGRSDKLPRYALDDRKPFEFAQASAGDTILAAAPATPSEAQTCGYTRDDLGTSPDIQLSAEIRALAQQLGYSPARIFQYVSNDIQFEPYWGSLKGAGGTLHSKSGGPTDQASLLIALLRASNIPARYVRGTAEFFYPPGFEVDDSRGLKWIGAKTYAAATAMLARGGNPSTTLIVVPQFNNMQVGMRFEHVWVEACVAYGNYRGMRVDASGHRWIPLDPSFKERNYQAGIQANVAFDYANYLAQRSNDPDSLPNERFAKLVDSAIKNQPPRYANNTLADVPYQGQPAPREFDILPVRLPYRVVQFTNWYGTTSSEATSVPDEHRYKFKINARDPNGASLGASLSLNLAETALKRITLSFKGASANDQTLLDAWRNNPDMLLSCASGPAGVIPVIKVEGQESMVGTVAVPFCSTTNQLGLELRLEELGSQAQRRNVSYSTIAAANYYAVMAYAFQPSDRLLRERSARLLASVQGSAENANANSEEIEGELLNVIGLKYLRY
ncbi:MAG TPA: transglutaminase-like domain-containing protein, partial [Burkholderiales bacterium]